MKLSQRILLAPGLALLFLLAFGTIAFRALRVDQEALGEIYGTRFAFSESFCVVSSEYRSRIAGTTPVVSISSKMR